jgi:hypothetical protein
MADTEGFNLITNGATLIVGVDAFQIGTIAAGAGIPAGAVGQPIYAAIQGIRVNGAPASDANPVPVKDVAAEGSLVTIAANTAAAATAAAQATGNASLTAMVTAETAANASLTGILAAETAGNASLVTIAAAQGAGGTGIAGPAGGTGILGFLSGLWGSIGVAGTGISQPTGGTGLLGMLSGILSALQSVQTVKVTSAAVPLDLTTTAAANTAVNVLNAGHAIAGGFVIPSAAGFFNQITNAGTTGVGSDIPVNAGQVYTVQRSPNAVSFISNTPTVTFAGYGGT